ncbi:MAG: hypothetical protein HY075_04040 [Deltaproteobacteria bacterium]|nr:hypothetical protein [Deltaproteobacteria bacterium]
MVTTLALLFLTAGAHAHEGPSCATAQRCMSADLAARKASSHGLVVEFAVRDGGLYATLDDVSTLRDPRSRVVETLTEIPCKVVRIRPNPDDDKTVVTCESPSVVDSGYTIELLGAD